MTFQIASFGCLLFFALKFAQAELISPKLDLILKDKAKIALALSKPIARCVQRYDTDHASFHGCIDWHSAVHGTWALVVYTAMTGDQQYKSIVDQILQPRLLEQEFQFLQENPAFELPYGRAWFLRLVIDEERLNRDGKLLQIGDYLAATLLSRYELIPPNPLNQEYESSSWAIINMIDYFDFRGDEARSLKIRKIANQIFYKSNSTCDPEIESGGFMAVCTNWAWLVSKIISPKEFKTWVATFMPLSKIPTPINTPKSVHEFGLNFSRSWGLLGIYSASKKNEFANSYIDHIYATYEDESNWNGGYRTVAHWVPQFGMFAIQPLFSGEF
jgi:hypothetical protein